MSLQLTTWDAWASGTDLSRRTNSWSASSMGGHPGLFRDQPEPRIDICGFSDVSTAAKKTMLHELAHAWAHENLTDDDIEEFLILRGLEIWAGPHAPWELKGSEHAAEIVSWARFDRELDLVTIPDAGPEAIEASYRLLTGRSLPDR